jgi:cellulose synthase/poly-beta-1,6-N-acetylglucosamine synthase-like glycosyltransferase
MEDKVSKGQIMKLSFFLIADSNFSFQRTNTVIIVLLYPLERVRLVSEKKWTALFLFVGLIWFAILFSTLYQWAVGEEVLVDNEIDLSYVTLPLIGFSLVYTIVSIFIFSVYLVTYGSVEARQREKIRLFIEEGRDNASSSLLHSLSIFAHARPNRKLAGPISSPSLSPHSIPSSSEVTLPSNTSISTPPALMTGALRYKIATSNGPISAQTTQKGPLYSTGIGNNTPFEKNTTNIDSKQTANTVVEDSMCSVIIPSRNEEKVIGETIQNCLLQTYENFEIVVVCHNCTDKTYEEANKVQDIRVRPFDLQTKESGKGIALNYGIEKARGKYLLILDGDGRLSNDFIENAIPLFYKEDIVAVQGKYIPSNRNYNLITKLLSIEGDLWSTPYMTARSILNKKVYLGGTGFIIRKDALIAAGGFANHLVDDYELSCRLFARNHKISFAPLSIDYDEKPPSLSIMFRQRARWSRGFLSLVKKRAVPLTDTIGAIYWLSPLAAISGVLVLGIFGYAAVHNSLFEYYPYKYTYIPLNLWFILIGALFSLQVAVLAKEYGRKGLKYARYLVVFNPFSLYVFVTFIKGLFVKSWGDTKTAHGFVKKESIVR